MNWEAIGAVGEIAGALAVVATLVYLASQVRYAKTAANDSNRLERAAAVREMMLEYTRNDKLREDWVAAAGLEDYYNKYGKQFGLSPEEASRLDYSHLYWFWTHWAQFASSKSNEDIAELEHLVKNFYAMAPVRYSWENGPVVNQLDPEFHSFVNEILEGDN